MTPLVSIGVPTYNAAKYLSECLESIVLQTFHDFEVNIIDDCSTDNTISIAANYARQDRRIKVHRNSTRVGLPANFNRCLNTAQSKYVTVFGQDDAMLPENIALKLNVLEEHPRVGFVHSNVFIVNDTGSVLQHHWEENSKQDYICSGQIFARKLLLGRNQVSCSSVLMRKAICQEYGGFLEDLYYTCDWEMWMRIAMHYDIACLGAPLIKNRRHSGSETHRLAGSRHGIEQEVLAKEKLISKYGHLLQEDSKLRRIVRSAAADKAMSCALREFYENDLAGTLSTLSMAMRLNPLLLLSDCSFVALASKAIFHKYLLQYARIVKSISDGVTCRITSHRK